VPSIEPGAVAPAAPVIFAYDGSELAAHAIEQAGGWLAAGQQALVVCVWQPADVGFVTPDDRHFDADQASEVEKAAKEVAAHGASLAEQAGFRSQSAAVWAAPTWKGIVETADEHGAGLIVMGSHRRSGLVGRLLGSVAAAVVAHSACSVLVVHSDPRRSSPAPLPDSRLGLSARGIPAPGRTEC
jgi:nucleotide-binding universal stress UspA family protein